MGAKWSGVGKPTSSKDKGKFPPPQREGDGWVFHVVPLGYERWAFEVDDLGLVGLIVSEAGFRVVSTEDNRVLKQIPMAKVEGWSGTKKIFKITYRADAADEAAKAVQLSTPWTSAILEALDKVIERSLSHRRAKAMTDDDFTALLETLRRAPPDDPTRLESALAFAGPEKWVNSWQCIEMLRVIPASDAAGRRAFVVAAHPRMLDPRDFRLVMLELATEEERNLAWEAIHPKPISRKGSFGSGVNLTKLGTASGSKCIPQVRSAGRMINGGSPRGGGILKSTFSGASLDGKSTPSPRSHTPPLRGHSPPDS